jgi:HlyD family secretion protein
VKRRIPIIVGAAAILLLAVWFVMRSRSNATPAFRFATVERGSILQTVSATGTLSAIKTVQVGTRVSGQVAELHADFNDHVTKGQLLARIDPTLQQQAVADATAQLGKAQAQYDQAKAEHDRNQPLFAQKFISATDFTTFQTNMAVGLAGLKSAQVTLNEANQNLAYTNIYAPISGVVIVRSVDLGQTVAASLSAPQLFLIAQDLSKIQILAAVDESDIAAVKDSQTVRFTVEAYPDTFTARVGQVRLQSQLTDNVVNYTVVVVIDNADGRLLPGMTATVQFITGSATDVLIVPNLALRYKPTAAQLAAAGIGATDTSHRRDSSSTGRGVQAPAPVTGGRGGSAAAGSPTARPKRSTPGGPGSIGTLYLLDKNNKLTAIRVRIGLSDGQRTQITGDSLVAGMQVIVGVGTSTSTAAAPSTNPLTPQRSAGGGGRGGP